MIFLGENSCLWSTNSAMQPKGLEIKAIYWLNDNQFHCLPVAKKKKKGLAFFSASTVYDTILLNCINSRKLPGGNLDFST